MCIEHLIVAFILPTLIPIVPKLNLYTLAESAIQCWFKGQQLSKDQKLGELQANPLLLDVQVVFHPWLTFKPVLLIFYTITPRNESIINSSGSLLVVSHKLDMSGFYMEESKGLLAKASIPFTDHPDVVIFDFEDGGGGKCLLNDAQQDSLTRYIEKGGSVLWTHDFLDWGFPKKPILYTYAGVTIGPKKSGSHSLHEFVEIRDTPMFNSIMRTSGLGFTHTKDFPISSTHWTLHITKTTGQVVLGYAKIEDTGYLIVNQVPGGGRCAYIAAGHSYAFTEAETHLFYCLVKWLTGKLG